MQVQPLSFSSLRIRSFPNPHARLPLSFPRPPRTHFPTQLPGPHPLLKFNKTLISPLLLLPTPPRSSSRSHVGPTDHHHSHHHHGHEHEHGELSGAQEAVLRFARAVGWARLADLLRESYRACLCSVALLLLAAASPRALPARVAGPAQTSLVAVAFPLVGVCFSFLADALELLYTVSKCTDTSTTRIGHNDTETTPVFAFPS